MEENENIEREEEVDDYDDEEFKEQKQKKDKTKEVNVDGERVFLKKDFLGWHIVNPVKIDGKIVLKNLIAGGSWIKLIAIIIFVLIMLGAIFEVQSLIQTANECINQTTIPQINS